MTKSLKYYNAITVILFFIATSTLINSHLFINLSSTAYYGYCLTACLFISTVGIVFSKLNMNKGDSVIINLPFVILLAYILYVIANSFFISHGLNFHHYYLIISGVLLISIFLVFERINYNPHLIFKIIVVLGFVESLICILQFFNLADSFNTFFRVTGTWVNPNVTAMFLAMVFPATLCVIFITSGFKKKTFIGILAFIIIGLLSLKCRSAIIGAVVASAIMLQYRFKLIEQFTHRFNIISKVAMFIISGLALSASFFYGYQQKKASADGRKLIWNISFNMIAKRPLMGYGYGNFERNYNIAQGDFFKSGKGTYNEKLNAAHVQMAYNECLENAVEGGLIGFTFSGMYIMSLLVLPLYYKNVYRKDNDYSEKIRKGYTLKIASKEIPSIIIIKTPLYIVTAYSGVATFTVMGIFNFTIEAIPTMFLFVLYAAILTIFINCQYKSYIKNNHFTVAKIKWLGYSLFIIGGYLGILQITMVNASFQNKTALQLARVGRYADALSILESSNNKLQKNDSYWNIYGNILMAKKKYRLALEKFIIAQTLSSDPDIFINTAYCYEKLKLFDSAKANYITAKNIEPILMAPSFRLMNLYLKTKDTANAINMADELLIKQPKNESTETAFYKREAVAIKNINYKQ